MLSRGFQITGGEEFIPLTPAPYLYFAKYYSKYLSLPTLFASSMFRGSTAYLRSIS